MTDDNSNKGGIICCVLLLVIIGIFAFIGSQLSNVYFDNGYENSFDIFVDGNKKGSVAPNSMEKISIKKGEHRIEIRKKDGELFESNDVTLTEYEYIYNIGRKYLYYKEICEYKVGGGTKWGGWATKNIGSETLIKYPNADYGFDEDCPGSIVVSPGNTYEERTNLKKEINPTAVELSGTVVTVEDVIEVDTDLYRVPYAEECSYKKDCCNLTISGVLDDHYTSTGNYHLSVYVEDIEVFYCDQSPFSHGEPPGIRFSNWKIIKVPVPNHVMDGEKISITLEHTDSPKSDWIGIDYLEFEFDGKIIKKELNEYKNYGVKDGAAGILYGDESQTWDIKLMAADEMEENESRHETPVDKSLVGYWNFDEDSGDVASDLSGCGNDGTIHGATWTTGISGKALQFDGMDDYVDCGSDSSLNIADEITIEAWVKPRSLSNKYMCIAGKDRSGGPKYDSYSLKIMKNNNLAFELIIDGTDKRLETSLSDEKWSHFVGTYDGLNMILYKNGLEVNHVSVSGLITTQPNTNFVIGAYSNHDLFFNGIIDDVAIYSRALTPEEINAHYLAKRAGGSTE